MAYSRLSLENIADRLPTFAESDDIPDVDVLILAAGFEPRCATVARKLQAAGRRVPHTITLHFPTNLDENAVIWEELDGIVEAISEKRTAIQMTGSSLEFDSALLSALPPMAGSGATRVLLDVSGASGRMILLTLRALFSSVRQDSTHIDLAVAYTEANEYAPSKEEADATIAELKHALESHTMPGKELTLGLDRDPQDLCVVYEGHHVEDGPDRAIVICGFNAHRIRAALDNIDPSFNTNLPHPQVTYVAGEPPRPDRSWRLDAMKELNAFGTDPAALHYRTSSTLHYEETLRLLEQLYEKSFGAERITVLPFGSKMQTIATALFCELHADVRAQIVTPKAYRGSGYSTGSGPTHILNFGVVAELIDVLASVGSIVRS